MVTCYMALQALSGSGVGKVKIVPVLLEKVNLHSYVFTNAEITEYVLVPFAA